MLANMDDAASHPRRTSQDPNPSHRPEHRLRPAFENTPQRNPDAAVYRALTAARPGRGCSSATTRPRRSTSPSIARIQRDVRRAVEAFRRNTRCRAAAGLGDSFKSTDAARRGQRSHARLDCRGGVFGRIASRRAPRIRIASMRSSRNENGRGCSRATTPARLDPGELEPQHPATCFLLHPRLC